MTTALFWFRKDLRLKDNIAWAKACEAHRIHPVLVLEPELISNAGSYRRRQFFLNVSALAAEIKSIGGELSVIQGPAKDVLPRYIRTTLTAYISMQIRHPFLDKEMSR